MEHIPLDRNTSAPASASSCQTSTSNDRHEDGRESYEKQSFDSHKPYKDLECDWRDPEPHLPTRRYDTLRVVLGVVFAVLTVGVLAILLVRPKSESAGHGTVRKASKWSAKTKPNFPIVASVFYGRRRNVEILDCYLRRNLVTHGGYLDRVQFIANTNHADDDEWLDQLLAIEVLYSKVNTTHQGWDWTQAWQAMTDNSTMYIKIDDDVLFIADDAIPELVHTLLERPDALSVGANAVNEPDMIFLGYHNNVILPFLPEPITAGTRYKRTNSTTSWRPSELPPYPLHEAHIPDHYDLSAPTPGTPDKDDSEHPSHSPPKKHRWLPLPPTYANLHKTPIDRITYCADNRCDQPAYRQWTAAAQSHYSLLAHLDAASSPNPSSSISSSSKKLNPMTNPTALAIYHFGAARTGTWDTQLDRYRINFLAMWGSTVIEAKLVGHDELKITNEVLRRTGRPFLVQTRAVVAHFSFHPQEKGMESTDVRERYRAFANEMVCAADRQIRGHVEGSGNENATVGA